MYYDHTSSLVRYWLVGSFARSLFFCQKVQVKIYTKLAQMLQNHKKLAVLVNGN